jgi:triphosphoribosyl-dephospho-CoA synthase
VHATTANDTAIVYEAIRTAMPGGMGEVEQGDVSEAVPRITLIEAMQLAADRDTIARQYVNGFEQVWETADLIESQYAVDTPLGKAIVHAHVSLMSRYPDSLITRKCGGEIPAESQARAAAVLAKRDHTSYAVAIAEFDAWLRADGHKRNPGTTADLIAAGLFVLLVEKRLTCPVTFY